MRYYKTVENDFIVSVSTGSGGEEISEQEYEEILAIIRNKPTASEGFDYRLKTDLTWEEYDRPEPEPSSEEAGPEDYEQALKEMGVDFND